MARPDQSAGHAMLESTTIILLTLVKNKHCFILYVVVALGAVTRVNWVNSCVSEQRIAKGVLRLKKSIIWTSTTNRGKDTKKVITDRIKKAEERLQIGNGYHTLADLGDDDMDKCHDLQNTPVKLKINSHTSS